VNLQENISRIREVMGMNEEKDPTAKFIKCKNCKKKFTQTIHKGKKSLPICPNCGTHNIESKKEIEEEDNFSENINSTVRRHLYNLDEKVQEICNLFVDGYVSNKSFCKSFPNSSEFETHVQHRLLMEVIHKSISDENLKKQFIKFGSKLVKKLYTKPIKEFYKTKCKFEVKNQVKEGFTDLLLKKLNKYPFQEYQKPVNNFMNLLNLKQINDDEDFLKVTHLVKPSGEVVVRVRNSSEKKGKIIYVSWKLMNEIESYIPSPGLVICVAKWVEKKLNLENVKGWEIFLD